MFSTIRIISILILGLYHQSAFGQTIITAQPKFDQISRKPNFDTPEYILPCNRTDVKLDLCIQKSFNHLRPYLVRGISELDLPPIEPLTIPELGMKNDQGAVRVHALFSNITAFGPGNYSVTKVRVNITTLRLDLHLKIPKIDLQGHYKVVGNILLFPIQSEGNFWASFGDVAAIAKVQGVEEIRDGISYMRIARLIVDFNLDTAAFNVVDQLKINNVLGQAMNKFLNENAKEIIEEMKPAARSSIAKHFQTFLNTAFTKVPMNVWLRDN
ncbi:protein takeout-like [Leptopilina boulardi]|uniref:protein takeout-like n=1 Tax=Leptopilina boulardi TaxID=63433 RepID=UPI0021F5269A|nr:protein takeout-like [Leptopilina boulardi]